MSLPRFAMPWSKTWREAVRAALLILAAALQACSQSTLPPRAGLTEERPKEQALQLPPYPKQEHLARIDTGHPGSFEFFIDTQSVDLPAADTIRYTLVAKSSAGASNVTHEALRCKGRDRRLYALGRPDATWVPVRRSEWTPYSRTEYSQIHVILAEDYFCPNRQSVPTAQEAVRALQAGGHPDVRR
jgi:hypothetical protein